MQVSWQTASHAEQEQHGWNQAEHLQEGKETAVTEKPETLATWGAYGEIASHTHKTEYVEWRRNLPADERTGC